MVELREHERKTLLALHQLGGKASVEDLVKKGGLSDSAVMRAAVNLQDKKLASVCAELKTVATLNEEGKTYAKEGLPERGVADALRKLGGSAVLGDVAREADLENRFIPIALGWLQKKGWARFDPNTKTLRLVGAQPEGNDERLLRMIEERGQAVAEDMDADLSDAVRVLKGRKLLELNERTTRFVELTRAGQAAVQKGLKGVEEVTQLTPDLIISGKWRGVKLQKYNIQAEVARTWPGKKHPYMEFLDEVKRKLVELGFKEMWGTSAETSFFNFDALYTPQDHPAREIFDVYFLRKPKYGEIGASKRVLGHVKETHENGWKTGSTGWRYRYSLKEAKRLILRGHGTCLSARTLLARDLEIPGRYFSIARCYRPDVPDKTHLTEFNQVEGIVVDEHLNLRDLLGILTTFAVEIAKADRVRLRPDYYPFTEPSVELSAYKEGYGWIEFGGSGIFRPEVVMPLEIDVPVIAWGLGIDRLFMMKTGVDDIREIFSQNLDWIRRQRVA
jgi:phenylalanyl-tRNA synthetase alpha chain